MSMRSSRIAAGAARLLVGGVLLAALGALVLASLENRFIFFPMRELEADPSVARLPFETVHVSTADGLTLHGWFLPAPGTPTILYLHGNAGNVSHRLEMVKCLVEQGYPVLIMDYRGYGLSEGKPTEQGLYLDAQAMYGHLVRERGLAPSEIVAWGKSLGGAVAIDLATREPLAGLVLESTFLNARAMARLILPWWPERFVRAGLASDEKLARLAVPKLIIHGDRDSVVPVEQGQKLYELAAPPKSLHVVEGGEHDDFLLNSRSDLLVRVERFLKGE